jgi:hypothetical protein
MFDLFEHPRHRLLRTFLVDGFRRWHLAGRRHCWDAANMLRRQVLQQRVGQ